MEKNRISIACAEGHSPNLEDLVEAMFIEGARVLGFEFNAPISVDAQEKIVQAANSLSEKLAILLELTNDIEREPLLGN
jgi:hypothetical protein